MLTTPEILRVRDDIYDVGRMSVYSGGEYFKEWALQMWDLRQNSEKGTLMHAMSKRLATALHGRFGYRPTYWTEVEGLDVPFGQDETEWTVPDPETGRQVRFRQMLGVVEREVKLDESKESCPVVASHITAYARLRLLDLIEEVGLSRIMYCDTDGILVGDGGLKRVPEEWFGSGIGELSYEQYNNVKIWGVKRYVHAEGLKLAAYSRKGKPVGGRWEWEEWSDWWPYTEDDDGMAYAHMWSIGLPKAWGEGRV